MKNEITYLDVYLARETVNDKIEILGNYLKDDDGNLHLVPVASFDKDKCGWKPWNYDRKFLRGNEIITSDDSWKKNLYGDSYYLISINDLEKAAKEDNYGFRNGYVKRKDIGKIENSNYCVSDSEVKLESTFDYFTDSPFGKKTHARFSYWTYDSPGGFAARLLATLGDYRHPIECRFILIKERD